MYRGILSFSDYNLPLSNEVPLIDRAYGYNIYSLFGNGERGAQAAGRLSRGAPDLVEAGYVHPSMITGLNGALAGGHTIYIRGSAVGSAGYRVGDGTFAAGGAVGLSFSYPVQFRFYEVVEGEAPPEEPPAEPPGPGEPPEEPPGPEEPPEPEQVTVTARLDLPAQTYEGHRVFAVDSSLFETEGRTLSALRAYSEKLAVNRFSLAESGAGSISRRSAIQAEAVFARPGNFHVQLDVDTQSGDSGRDVKPIQVLATPSIRATLGGVQKQNRKQLLSLAVAQNPQHPLSALWVELEDPATGQTVRLEHRFGAQANTLQNSAEFKTRPLKDSGSSGETVCLELEFLTKNDVPRDYVYRVFARDSRGRQDSVEGTFSVARDEPPRAAMDLAESWLRDKGSNTARIQVGDASLTDGDQLSRRWIYRTMAIGDTPLESLGGYRDLSFGTAGRVAFEQEGVGPFELELRVRDVWTEETLPEYVDESDYLSGACTASALVDNVAPVVSMEPVRSRELEVLLFAPDQESLEAAEAGSAQLRSLLLAEGIDARVTAKLVFPDDPLQPEAAKIGTLEAPYGFQGTWSGFWEEGSVTGDEDRIYKAEATWTPGATEHDCYPEQPYVLRAFDARTLAPLWTYTLSAGHFPVDLNRARQASFGHDSQGRFLYWMIDGRTILLDKKTGAELAILPFLAGRRNSVAGEYIFCYKSDGIYRVSMGDGAVRKIASEELFAGDGAVQTLGGRDSFLIRRGGELLRGLFDPESQKLELVRLQGTAGDSPAARVFAVGQDAEGLLVTSTVLGTSAKLRAFDTKGRLLWEKSAPVTENFPDCALPIYDSGNRIRYMGIRNIYRSSSAKTVATTVYGLFDGYSGTASVRNTEGYPTEAGRLLFGVEKENGKVLVGMGAQWTYIANSGFNNGPVHGMPERTAVLGYAPAAGTAAPGAHSDLCSGLNSIIEYGTRSPGLLLLSTGTNHEYQPAAVHTTHVIALRESCESRMDRLRIRYLPEDPSKAFSKLLAGPPDPAALASEILARPEDQAKTMILTTQTPSGSLSKSLALRPGIQYYYEYSTTAPRDIFSVTARAQTAAAASLGEGGHYRVREEYLEDFSGPPAAGPFDLEESRFLDGWYDAAHAYLYQGSDWSNRYISASSDIAFSVPAGSLGALSFDYDILRDSGFMANYFALIKDGGQEEIWDEYVAASGKGHYTRHHLLEPGSYVLRAYARGYGGRLMDYYTRLDNLRLSLVEPIPIQEGPLPEFPLECKSTLQQNGGVTRVRGQFLAPPAASAYSSLNVEKVTGVNSSPYSALSGQPGRYVMTVMIPPGQQALYLGVDTLSRPTITNGKNYNNVNYTWLTDQWSCSCNNRYPQSALTNIPWKYRIAKENLTDTQVIRQESSTYRGSYGDFTGLEAALTRAGVPVPAAAEEGRLVFAEGAVFAEDGRFSGSAEIAFRPGEAGEIRVGDFQLYSLEEGERVYVEQTAFTRETMLQEWTAEEARAAVAAEEEPAEPEALPVYAKGERVALSMQYSDYEADPSKTSFWRYTHTPMNDGLHPQSGAILAAPLERFYVDGKYVAEHWQEDDAARKGGSPYDKPSNVCIYTFYIEGSAVNAPWITYLGTEPAEVEPGDAYQICVGVDDVDKDALELSTEIYFGEAPGLPFFTHFKEGIEVDGNGKYPPVRISVPGVARAGRYDVISVVRDAGGAGLKHYRFRCVSPMSITGKVDHTPEWENNRVRFNQKWFGEDVGAAVGWALYSAQPSPRARGTNVFWPGERLCLSAQAGGAPLSVTATLADHPAHPCALSVTGPADPAGRTPYAGDLWSPDLWAGTNTAVPSLQTVRFVATYPGGLQQTCEVPIILDGDIGYWMLHRLY